jgi:hypothetical protein
VIDVYKSHWVEAGVTVAAAAAGSLLFIAAAGGGVRSASTPPFDLAIREISVKQLSSTPMFRTVEITCVVENRGPRISNATGWLLISRPSDAGPQVLRMVAIPKRIEPGDQFEARSQGFAWVAAAVPYRCEIEFGGTYAAGDADASNDVAELTFPRL